ncbi:MAG: hypothetical protein J0M09_12810 [Xanthomonadales bacterium]|nr:hypothetical protein [Xanthomonadales bacterium]
MNAKNDQISSNATWFVGASYGGTDDQMPRFLSEAILENGYDDKYLDLVRSMRPGDRIAIKRRRVGFMPTVLQFKPWRLLDGARVISTSSLMLVSHAMRWWA